MATAAIFSSLRRRRSPSLEVFLAPVDLSDLALIGTLALGSDELVSRYSGKSMFFQRKNSRSLIRRIEVFAVLLEYLRETESRSTLPPAALLCLKELYLLLYRSKILLDYCSQSGQLWLLLQNRSISGHFHDLNQEIYTLLDVFPINEVELSEDIREQIELLQRQSRKDHRLYIDKHDEALRVQFFRFMDQFENGHAPSPIELEMFFIGKVGIRDARSCRVEIEFLEEKVVNHQGDIEPPVSMLNGFIALTRYCRFLLYGSEEEEDELELGTGSGMIVKKKTTRKRNLVTREIAETFLSIPKDFCCPISLDLMRDPVITSTGQTYDRISISKWVEQGHVTCPKTGQVLSHVRFVPNRALRNLITQWCSAHGIPYEPLETVDSSMELLTSASPTKETLEANKATEAHHIITATELF